MSEHLTQFLASHLPLSEYLGVEVANYDGKSLTLRAPLGPSLNDKLTAFGGSLYCLCVMSCWGMVYLQILERGLDGNLVVSRGQIDYLCPVATDIEARCTGPGEEVFGAFFRGFEQRGRAKLTLESKIVVDGKTAVKFRGEYAFIAYK